MNLPNHCISSSSMDTASFSVHSMIFPSGSSSTRVGAATMPYLVATLSSPSVSITNFQSNSCSLTACCHFAFLS